MAEYQLPHKINSSILVGEVPDECYCNYTAHLYLKSRYNNFELSLKVGVVDRIPYHVSSSTIKSLHTFEVDVPLADSSFSSSSSVDILIGEQHADVILLGRKQFMEAYA